MQTYSKGHEREENRMMNKGFVQSLMALLLFFVPVISLVLSVSGFWRMCVRVTQAHKVKRALMTLFAGIVMIAMLGTHIGAVYHYVRDPGILDDALNYVWHALTGQENVPWNQMSLPVAGEDPYAGYGEDPYEGDLGLDTDEDIEDGYGADFDAAFDDSELEGFDEDDTQDSARTELFNQFMNDKRTNTGAPSGVG